jgi:hypothetical protein
MNYSMNESLNVHKSPLHGDGVVAQREITAEEFLFEEVPRFFLQTLTNRHNCLVCGNCGAFVGSISLQMKYLQKLFNRQTLQDLSQTYVGDELQGLSEILPCGYGCGEYYCSDECRQSHWFQKGHKFLCTGLLSEEDAMESPLFQYKTFCLETNEIFLLVANILAEFCSYMDMQSASKEDISSMAHSFDSYVRELWWNVATSSLKGKEKIKLEKSLKKLVKDATQMLQQICQLKERGLDDLFNEEYIAR